MIANMTVCGEGLTQIVRNLYCFEQNKERAPHSELGKDRTQDQIDFDDALDKYLDEHSGKLFNGDE